MGAIHQEVRQNHLQYFPDEEQFLRPFLNGFDVTWARRKAAKNTTLSFYFLRPEGFLQETFGFQQEMLLVYSSFSTLEARTIQAADQILAEEPARGRVDRLAFLLVSEMDEAEEWVGRYVASNQEPRLIVPFSARQLRDAAVDPWYIRNRLADHLFSRDLFDVRLPLERDTDFYGREAHLLELRDAARRGENRGLFGLRKTGKTSLLFKLERVLESEAHPTCFFDCKSPSIRQLRWHELLAVVATQIADKTGLAFSAGSDVRLLPDKVSELLERFPERARVSLVFDEIEYISPLAVADTHWREEFVPFWQALWAAQSKVRRISFVVSGVNPSVVEVDRVGVLQNPLFGIVPYQYVRGLAIEDVRRMMRSLGKRMGLKFDESAVSAVHARYGGHPLLTRLACSQLHRELASSYAKRPVEISGLSLKKSEEQRDAVLAFYCRHVVSELQEFYPDEYEMLELLATGRTKDFLDLAVYPEYAQHLNEYGLLTRDGSGMPKVAIPVVGRFVALEEARRSGRGTMRYVVPLGERDAWVRRRIGAILQDMKGLERVSRMQSLPSLFGVNSFPEADRLVSVPVAADENQFEAFINCLNRCFVESIDNYGDSTGKKKYFWTDVKTCYPAVFEALRRVRVYRHHRMHIVLNPSVEDQLQAFLRLDLEGKEPRQVTDVWFVLQQVVIDELLAGLQADVSRLSQ